MHEHFTGGIRGWIKRVYYMKTLQYTFLTPAKLDQNTVENRKEHVTI